MLTWLLHFMTFSTCIQYSVEAFALDIHLHKFSQSQRYTECARNLLIGDRLHMTASVKAHTTDEILSGYFLLEKKNLTDKNFKEYQIVLVNDCNEDYISAMTCKHNAKEYLFQLILNTEAEKSLSEAKMRLKVDVNRFEKTSEEIQIPTIFDPLNVKIKLNDDILNGEEDSLHLSNHTVKICCTNAPSPCDVVIAQEGGVEIKGSDCLTVSLNRSGVYLIGYYVCKVGNFSQRYKRNITLKNFGECVDIHNYLVWIIPVILVIAIVVIAILLYRKGYISLHPLCKISNKEKHVVGFQSSQKELELLNVVSKESCNISVKESPKNTPRSPGSRTRSMTSKSERNALRKRKDVDSKKSETM